MKLLGGKRSDSLSVTARVVFFFKVKGVRVATRIAAFVIYLYAKQAFILISNRSQTS